MIFPIFVFVPWIARAAQWNVCKQLLPASRNFNTELEQGIHFVKFRLHLPATNRYTPDERSRETKGRLYTSTYRRPHGPNCSGRLRPEPPRGSGCGTGSVSTAAARQSGQARLRLPAGSRRGFRAAHAAGVVWAAGEQQRGFGANPEQLRNESGMNPGRIRGSRCEDIQVYDCPKMLDRFAGGSGRAAPPADLHIKKSKRIDSQGEAVVPHPRRIYI